MALSCYDPERHRSLAFLAGIDLGVAALSYTAETLWYLGYADQALKTGNKALALAQALSHPHTLSFAKFFFGIVSQFRREILVARETAESAITLSVEHGFTAQLALTTFQRGWAMAKQGHHQEGITQMQEAQAAIRATGSELGWPHYLNLLADAYTGAGRLAEGWSALTEAFAFADEHEDRLNEGETHRLKGELLLRQNGSNAADANKSFERAIEIARNQSSKSFEMRAKTSLARLLRDTGRRDEARAMLAEIYGWFTEGFDTADLKDAQALLDELGA